MKGNKTMADLKKMWNDMDLQDRMVVGGSLLMAVLTFFPWYSVTESAEVRELAKMVGVESSHSRSGLADWNGWMALIFGAASALWFLAKDLFAGVKEPLRGYAPLGLPAIGFLLGPLAYFSRADSIDGPIEAGPTFWMWLAFLGGAIAVAGAAWKRFGKTD